MFRLVPYGRNQVAKNNDSFFNLMDDFFSDDFFSNGLIPASVSKYESFKIDVKDNDTEYLIEADLPGVKKEDLTVDYKDNRLVIRVNSNQEVNEEKDNYIHRERRQSQMERSFYMKDVKADEITAKLEEGVLAIHAPKLDEIENMHKIEVQ
jgi:HSP20 family protein